MSEPIWEKIELLEFTGRYFTSVHHLRAVDLYIKALPERSHGDYTVEHVSDLINSILKDMHGLFEMSDLHPKYECNPRLYYEIRDKFIGKFSPAEMRTFLGFLYKIYLKTCNPDEEFSLQNAYNLTWLSPDGFESLVNYVLENYDFVSQEWRPHEKDIT